MKKKIFIECNITPKANLKTYFLITRQASK